MDSVSRKLSPTDFWAYICQKITVGINVFSYINDKAWLKINIMRRLKYKLDRKLLETIFITLVRPLLEHGDNILDNCTTGRKNELGQNSE